MYPPIPPPMSSSSPSDAVDTPLLSRSIANHLIRSRHLLRRPPPPLRDAASRLLRRASSRRMMLREPSVRVREVAAEQLEERQTDWAYSKPIIVLDVLWNLAFVIISIAVLALSLKEIPGVPLRIWIVGYVLQCLFHIGCVIVEYKKRRERQNMSLETNGESVAGSSSGSLMGNDAGDSHSESYGAEEEENENDTSFIKSVESANTMFSFVWWIIGFYWVTVDGNALTHNSPQLYWLCVTFLAFDVVFVVICIVVACLVGIAVCCCLPCIIAILYALADREGATEEEIDRLPKYKFRRVGEFEKINGEVQESYRGIMTESGAEMPMERVLSHEDAECCICLSVYDDGSELRELPCRHHFHCACIDKWLFINATCPLCKYNILKSDDQSGSEEV